jgi:fructokinase
VLIIVAVGLARLGSTAALLTGISTDVLGERLRKTLVREGVDISHIVRTGRRTTLSLVGLDATGTPSYTFYGVGSADCSLTVADMPTLSSDISGLHFGSYSIAVAPTADAFAHLARREQHRLISLDPNVRLNVEPDIAVWKARIDALLPFTSLVKVSTEDLGALFPERTADDVAQDWLSRGPALVIITDGAKGATARTHASRVHIHARTIPVADTIGAGDAFQAAILHQLSATQRVNRDAIRRLDQAALTDLITTGTHAAAITCSRRGADLPTARDLENAV